MTEKTIAFYSPLKPVDHQTPSGDRLMARLLVDSMRRAGFNVDVASHLRAFLKNPDGVSDKALLLEQADLEIQRLSRLWRQQGVPALWFCYHPYFKSPDLVGPQLCTRFGIPYVTAEASYSKRRGKGVWAAMQASVLESVNQAAVNICFTDRDRAGLRNASSTAVLARLRPFIDTAFFTPGTTTPDTSRLVTVAMMRAGDKMRSYATLADALKRLLHLPWTLSVVGDGPLHDEVQKLFCTIPSERLQWHGLLESSAIATLLAQSSLYIWPGCGEAYGLAYLEAQAAGVPVVAFETAGVPEVVVHGQTGILTPDGDINAYVSAVSSLLCNPQRVQAMSEQAMAHVQHHHSLEMASTSVHEILHKHVGL
ncbi:MAG: glycosyltransferase family 4 protein [Granulosicoccus sp.]